MCVGRGAAFTLPVWPPSLLAARLVPCCAPCCAVSPRGVCRRVRDEREHDVLMPRCCCLWAGVLGSGLCGTGVCLWPGYYCCSQYQWRPSLLLLLL